ncbi:hypothetical protein MHUMG1_03603 [Metarhizium humberi]|uniref:Uncharacterized protein n=1 Tax=Metarhizium humberi TaxID=2596975 RepID=A0A9P8S839_9HYPO|nr:hypothetical protein MHUMG1_03603 [Metarhizium humberi]
MDAMFSSLRCYFLAPGPRRAAATPKTKDSLGVFAAAADGGEPQVDTWAKRHMVLDGYDGAVSLRRAGVSIEAAWRRGPPCPPPVPAPSPLRTSPVGMTSRIGTDTPLAEEAAWAPRRAAIPRAGLDIPSQ